YARNTIELLAQQPLVVAGVAHGDADVVVIIARYEKGLQYFWNLRKCSTELIQRFLAVAFQRDVDNDRVHEAQAGRIQIYRVAPNDACRLHALDAIPARRGRQAHFGSDLVEAGTSVLLQGLQNS